MTNDRETPKRARRASTGSDATKNVGSQEHSGSELRASGRVTATSERIIRKISVKRRKAMQEMAKPKDPEPKPARDRTGTAPAPDKAILSRISDALEGTVTIAPGTDLTDPVDVDWEAMK